MSKIGYNKPRFLFAKPSKAENYKKWARVMQYSMKSVRLRDHIFEDKKNSVLTLMVLRGKNVEDEIKLKRHEKQTNKIQA